MSGTGYHRASGARGAYRSAASNAFEATYTLGFEGLWRRAWPAYAINADGSKRAFSQDEQGALSDGFDAGLWDFQRGMEPVYKTRKRSAKASK